VKEEAVARFHLAIDGLAGLEDLGHALGVGDILSFARHRRVIDASHEMRTRDHLETAILSAGGVERDHAAREPRKETAIVIPIAIILMPLPRAADIRLLGGQLRLEVVDRTAEHGLHRIDHALATRGEAINAVAGAGPQGDARRGTLRIGAIDHVIADRRIIFHRREEQVDFLAVVHATDNDETVAMIGIQ